MIDASGRVALTCPGDGFGNRSNQVYIWKTLECRPACAPLTHNGVIRSADLSPDGRLAATASTTARAVVWDTSSGARLHTLRHDGPVQSVAFHPDGKLLVTTGKEVRLWDATTRSLATKPQGCAEARMGCRVRAADGRYVIAADVHDQACAWNASYQANASLGPCRTRIGCRENAAFLSAAAGP